MMRIACLVLALGLLAPAMITSATAQGQGIVAIVNDQPVTEHDITQRIAILKILGETRADATTRKKALQGLVDEHVKLAEAKKFNVSATEADIDKQIERMAKNLQTDSKGFLARFKKQGISETTFRRYIAAQVGFNRIIAGKYQSTIKVSQDDVDRKYAEIKGKADAQISKILKDPRMRPVTVFELMEINLPVEGSDSALLQARAVEGQQFARRFKGCGSARAAAEGIFNVKFGKKVEADASKLPKQMKAALEKAGTGRAIGPMRGKSGIQLLALCGVRKITPPKPKFELPTRQQVENSLLNEKYDGIEEEYLRSVRNSIYVEYRDESYSQ